MTETKIVYQTKQHFKCPWCDAESEEPIEDYIVFSIGKSQHESYDRCYACDQSILVSPLTHLSKNNEYTVEKVECTYE